MEEDTEKKYIKEVTQRLTSKSGGYTIVKRKIKCTKKEFEETGPTIFQKVYNWNDKLKKWRRKTFQNTLWMYA